MSWLTLTSLVFFILFLIFALIFSILKMQKLSVRLSQVQSQLQQETDKEQKIESELMTIKNKISRNILEDSLTGLPNRQLFEDRLTQTINQGQRYHLVFGVLFLNLDGFKIINDALGHEIGDAVLKTVATRLNASVRQVDSVARFSSDEFVLLLTQLSKPETVAYVAQRVLDVISQPIQVQNQELFITASIGISLFPTDGEDVHTLLQNADNALHQAKSRGRNTYQFYREEMQALSRRELILYSSMRSASIYRDFTILYQPIIDIELNKVIAMDVILHWHHPDFGVISLREFFRLAENSGKVLEMGEWMLRTALQQLQKWNARGLHYNRVMVTISIRQLEHPQFAYKVAQMLKEFQLEPDFLVLKISEGTFTRAEMIDKALYMLKHHGVQIAIEEFGLIGLALHQLKRFPPDYLKIDESLIKDITVNKENESVINMILSIVKSLQVVAIASGVESQKQLHLLKQLGCRAVQGQLCSAPRKAEEFTTEVIMH